MNAKDLPPVCKNCSYDLTGFEVGGVCPECGRKIWLLSPRRLGERSANLSIAFGLAAILSYPAACTGCAGMSNLGIGAILVGQGCGVLGVVCSLVSKHRTTVSMPNPEFGTARTGFRLSAASLVPGLVLLGILVGGWLLGHQRY